MKRSSLFVSLCILGAILVLGVGCSKKPDDAKISSDIQNKFSQDSGLSTKQLTVQASNGVVTLSGTVNNDAERDAAGREAASVGGVKTVINNLQVGNTQAVAAQPAPAETASAPPAEKPEVAEERKPEGSRPRERSRVHKRESDDQQFASNDQPQENPAPAPAPTPVQNVAAEQAPPPPPPPPPKKFIIDQGTQLTVRLVDTIDSEKNQTGDTFHATLNTPLTSDGEQAVPTGADVTGHLVEVKSAGKFAGQSEVVMQLDSLSFGGRTYNLQTDQYKKQGSSRGKNTAEKVGGGALIGGIIGALAGGGKGAAIGAAAGAGVGGGVQAATKSQQIKLPSETVLNFTLQSPITVVQAHGSNGNRQRLNGQQ